MKVKPLKSLTKLEQEKQSKKLAGELNEELEATGQESEVKAAKWVKEIGKEKDKREQANTDQFLEILTKKRRFKFLDYWQSLAHLLLRGAYEEGYPWAYKAFIEDNGIVFVIYSPDKRKFARAFKPCGDPQIDFVAIEKFLEAAWVCINAWQTEENIKRRILDGKHTQDSYN